MKRYDFVVGIPCSRLKDLTASIDNYIPCTREDEALAIAIGASLVGKKPLVFLQNSGLGNLVDVVASLLKPYNIDEIDLLISLRSKPKHHEYMGVITRRLLKLLDYKKYKLIIE